MSYPPDDPPSDPVGSALPPGPSTASEKSEPASAAHARHTNEEAKRPPIRRPHPQWRAIRRNGLAGGAAGVRPARRVQHTSPESFRPDRRAAPTPLVEPSTAERGPEQKLRGQRRARTSALWRVRQPMRPLLRKRARQKPGTASGVSPSPEMRRFARPSAVGGGAERPRRHPPPRERQPRMGLQSSLSRRRPAGWSRMRAPV